MPHVAFAARSNRIALVGCVSLIGLLAGCSGAPAPTPTSIVVSATLTPATDTPATWTPVAVSASPAVPSSTTPSGTSRCAVTPGVPANATIHVTQDDLGFYHFDGPVTIKAGQAVSFANGNAVYHTITEGVYAQVATNACVDELLGTSSTVTVTFTKPGTYLLFCVPHPVMQTKVIVK